MKLPFRQGIARAQTDIHGTPVFLQKAGDYVSLVVSPDPTVLAFAHRAANYLVEEVRSVAQAWGPFTGTSTRYLYWDIDLATAQLTRGATDLPPLYSITAPPSPATDQHWFNPTDSAFYVWNGFSWIERVRLFAGVLSSGAVLSPSGLGTQAGLVGQADVGSILLDAFGRPMRTFDGTFATSTTWITAVNQGSQTTRLEETLMFGMAAEFIPARSAVTLAPGRRLRLARSTDHRTNVAGVVTEDLAEGEVGNVLRDGILRDAGFTFSDADVGKPLFCGPTGELTMVPPTVGCLQEVAVVYDADSVYVDVQPSVFLNEAGPPPPPVPSPSAPVADFSAAPTAGQAPLTVTFTDLSTNSPTALEWDFTNDGFVDSTSAAPTHTYSTPGTYPVRLRAANASGSDEEIKPGYIVVTAPSAGPFTVNLGATLIAAPTALPGEPHTVEVLVTNDGAATATAVSRVLRVRASDGSQVAVAAAGASAVFSAGLTVVTLPAVASIGAGSFESYVLSLTPQGGVTSMQIELTASSPETDPTPGDNVALLTIGVRA